MAKRVCRSIFLGSVPSSSSSSSWRRLSTLTASINTTTTTRNKNKKISLNRRLVALGDTNDANVSDILDQLLKENGKSVQKYEIIRIVNDLRKYKRYNHAIQMMEWLEKNRWDLSHGDHAVRLDLISKAKGVDAAEVYFNGLPDSAKNKLTYGALLHCYCEKKMTDKAMGLTKKMSEMKLDSSSLTYNNIISLHMKMGEPEKVPQLVQEMKEKNIKPDVYTYNLLMNSHASLKDIEGAERVVEEMKANGVKSDWSTYANLATIYVKAGLFEKADLALGEVEKMNDVHDKKAYHILMSLYSHTSNKLGVARVWESLRSAFRKPTNLSYLNLLQALARLGDTDGLEKYFKEWESGSLTYDIRVANVLIGSYLNRDMLKEAESILEGAKKREIKPNFRTLELFMNFYLQKRQMDLALNNLEAACSKVKENEWKPSQESVNMFFEYFEQEKDTESAEKLFQSLKKVDSVDSKVYASLLRSFVAAGKEETQMFQRIKDDGIEVTSEIKQLLERVCPN